MVERLTSAAQGIFPLVVALALRQTAGRTGGAAGLRLPSMARLGSGRRELDRFAEHG